MNSKSVRWPWVVQLLLIALGFAVLWGMAVVYVDAYFQRWAPARRISESLQSREDGEAIIATHAHYAPAQLLPSRTLDGAIVPADTELLTIGGEWFARNNERLYTLSESWLFRIARLNSSRQDGDVWWLIRDASDEGLTYLAGFDRDTRLPIGFVGRRGLRSDVPPESELFALGNMIIYSPLEAQFQRDAESPYERYVYLLDGDQLQEINLRTRKVRTVAELPGALSVAVVGVPLPASEDVNEDEDGERPEVANRDNSRRNAVSRVAVWLGDRIVMIDPMSDTRSDFPLPAEVRDAHGFYLHMIDADQSVILMTPDRSNPFRNRILWLTAGGETTRDETVELARYYTKSERENAALAGLAVPVPALFAGIVAWVAVASAVQGETQETFIEFAQIMNDAWPAVIAVALVCLAFAAFVYWQERRRGGAHALAWSVTAFCLGLPGLIAYLVERRPTALGRCDACGQPAPRNRPACTRCGQEFPRPRLLGTEVFA
jgi:hypothetical protein